MPARLPSTFKVSHLLARGPLLFLLPNLLTSWGRPSKQAGITSNTLSAKNGENKIQRKSSFQGSTKALTENPIRLVKHCLNISCEELSLKTLRVL